MSISGFVGIGKAGAAETLVDPRFRPGLEPVAVDHVKQVSADEIRRPLVVKFGVALVAVDIAIIEVEDRYPLLQRVQNEFVQGRIIAFQQRGIFFFGAKGFGPPVDSRYRTNRVDIIVV